jgi:hypothetical protein
MAEDKQQSSSMEPGDADDAAIDLNQDKDSGKDPVAAGLAGGEACPIDSGALVPGREGLLELIYGVLFDPANTFRCIAPRPPILLTLIIFSLLNLTLSLMGYIVIARLFFADVATPLANWYLHGLGPLLVLGGLAVHYTKWFVYSGLLNLLAELLGGRGRARSVFVVYGLAGIPTALMAPVLMLFLVILPPGFPGLPLAVLTALGVVAWSTALLVVGIREAHSLSTYRAALVVATPVAALFIALICGFLLLIAISARLYTLFG